MSPANARHLTAEELHAGMDEIRRSPKDGGVVKMIVRRPAVDERETVQTAEVDLKEGLLGDNWQQRGNPMTADGSADPEMQLNIMNARVIELVAISK
ncbi:MAG: MOSC domain-containing protein, partial [Woeseiaceae bacterium]|nr:MOSC domain-containing protein [Woeseiaceae bacterium]